MSTKPLSAAALDAQIVDEMMKERGRMLGVLGGIAFAMMVAASVAFVLGFFAPRPYIAFGLSLSLFGMAAGMSMWSYFEYMSLSRTDERRREAEEG